LPLSGAGAAGHVTGRAHINVATRITNPPAARDQLIFIALLASSLLEPEMVEDGAFSLETSFGFAQDEVDSKERSKSILRIAPDVLP